jgi:hypothetical protein
MTTAERVFTYGADRRFHRMTLNCLRTLVLRLQHSVGVCMTRLLKRCHVHLSGS